MVVIMRITRKIMPVLAVPLIMAVSGCATTTQDRIMADKELYETFPSEIQNNIRNGVIEPGYTEEMVYMALGKPDHVRKRATDEDTEEVWVYLTRRPLLSFGIGGTTGRHRSSIGTGMGVSTGGRQEQSMRVIFRDDKVHAVEKPRSD